MFELAIPDESDYVKMRISRGGGRYPVHFIPPKNMPGIIVNQSKWNVLGKMAEKRRIPPKN